MELDGLLHLLDLVPLALSHVGAGDDAVGPGDEAVENSCESRDVGFPTCCIT